MRDHIAARTDEPVDLEHTFFLPTGDRAAHIAGRRVREGRPDVVIIPVGAWLFTAEFVWLRIQRLFGKRAGRWARGIEEAFHGATYERGRVRQATNRALRWTAHKVIGGDTRTTQEETTGVFAETLRTIAREEGVEVVVVPGTGLGNMFQDQVVGQARARYMDDVHGIVDEHHFQWVDPASSVTADLSGGDTGIETDQLHNSLQAQYLIGEYVAAAYLENAKRKAELG